jgi:hypothetical protein
VQLCLYYQYNLLIKKSTIFWDITPCSPLKVNRRFGGTYRQKKETSVKAGGQKSNQLAGILGYIEN